MATETVVLRSRLRDAYRTAAASGVSLSDEIASRHQSAIAIAPNGQFVSSTSVGAQSVSFSVPGRGVPGPREIETIWSQLADLYDDCVAALGGSPTDAAIYAEMRDRLQPIRSFTKSFTGLRTA